MTTLQQYNTRQYHDMLESIPCYSVCAYVALLNIRMLRPTLLHIL